MFFVVVFFFKYYCPYIFVCSKTKTQQKINILINICTVINNKIYILYILYLFNKASFFFGSLRMTI